MSSSPPPPPPPGERPSFAEENAMRIASESLTHYDAASDTYPCSYGLLVRVEPRSHQVVGFSIPDFKAWHAAHAEPDGNFEIELPPTWPLGPDEDPAED